MRLNNILYIHIPRTGGTTFEKTLGFKGHDCRPACGNVAYGANYNEIMGWDKKTKIMLQHATYQQLINNKFIADDNDYIKISIVRDPYNRAISLYNYFGGSKAHKSFENFLNKLASLNNIGYFYMPQWKYLDGGIFNIIKFENFAQDLENINNKYNLDIKCTFDSSRHEKRGVSDLLTQENMDLINKIYRKDFEIYGYDLRHEASK